MAEAAPRDAPKHLMQQQLPHGVLECLCRSASPRQRAALSAVCKEWREVVLLSTTSLSVNLKSDTGVDSISQWLQQHAGQLQELELSTVGLYSRHIHPPTRLRLFQALHAAAGSTAAEQLGGAAAGAAGAAGASTSEEEEELDAEQQQQRAAEPQRSSDQQLQQAAASPASVVAAADADTASQQHHRRHSQQQAQVKPLRLTHLAVNARLAVPDCAAIASLPAPQLGSLALLGSRTRRLGFDGVGSLAQLRQLTSLKVERLGIGDDATVMLARSLTQLLQLSVSGNNIGPGGAAGISRHLGRLQQLDVSVNRIKDAGLASLCTSLDRLESLNLSGNIKFAPATLQQLQRLTSLTSLQASTTGLCNQGLAALANGLASAPLRVLDAAGNKISKVDAITALTGLTSLTLSRNPLQLACSKVLASSLPHLQELVVFDAVSAKQ
ncbi:hypothetical protein COO60DRAFT_899326 [Scenedesmus sp. NREL 46B-D3]|nr:hypothetical protein COO60DRAFT_899326 [Scenedesmus sp. NREL 46B-D3]